MPNYNKTPEHYEVQTVEEIDGFDKDQYGNTWYNVKFVDNAETFMWLAKNTPEEGKAYYGHIEPTKSGKRFRFKTDKVPDDIKRPDNAAKQPSYQKDEKQITKNMVWKNMLQHFDVPSMSPDSKQWEIFWGLVELHTEMLLPKAEKPKTTLTVEGESIDPNEANGLFED